LMEIAVGGLSHEVESAAQVRLSQKGGDESIERWY
jgi:hypothetical protein